MSKRVYLSKNPYQTTQEEHTPVSLRIQASNATVKALQTRLQDASRRDKVRLVRRISVLLDLLTQTASVPVLCERWGLSPSCLSNWQKAFLWRGLDSLIARHSGGRPEQLTPRQTKRLGEWIAAGPLVGGFETACWHAVLVRVLIWREFGVLYHRHDVCTLLSNLGFSFHKARLVSDQLDAAQRLAWLQDQWPALLRAAKRRKGLILFEDEASFAQWGALRDTGARRGHPPAVPTSGKRKGYTGFGAIDYCSGRLCLQGIEGRLNSDSYHTFWRMIMAQTTAHLFLIPDGARSHTSAATKAFLVAHHDRLTEYP